MGMVIGSKQLRQRADYTYKFNIKTGRHGWLRLTPAYSLKVVEELIVGHEQARRIFDPFCGTGTTALSAAYYGHEGVTVDINPFLVWLSKAKTAHYSLRDIATTRDACALTLELVKKNAVEPVSTPPLHNIERWWNPKAINFLRLLQAAVSVATKERTVEHTLLLVAFCRSLIKLSNAAFNHQSMSFRDDRQLDFEMDMASVFAEDVRFVLNGANENPVGLAQVICGDSRYPSGVVEGPFDLVITSPPYANRMSYIRELRPYMYWLNFLANGRDAGELDWTAIGGTWGIATSRLSDWRRNTEHFRSDKLNDVLSQIANTDNKNGVVLANYVAKYCDDMWAHFKDIRRVLSAGAEVHYIVGNSTFYGVLVPTEILYAEMLLALGFNDVECRPIRKRNSKKELVEFDVVARWG
ncbi:MAG: DNA adenine methylase [Deltaproteobacteria bacterium]|nr:DNA adenine methylase [Deltaproteobacteria bacterium]